MTTRNLTKLATKYSPKDIAIAARVLVDILAMQTDSHIPVIDPKDEFTPAQIKRLQKQLSEHNSNKDKSLSLTEVVHGLEL
jgi:hypothetical protein